MDTELSDEMEAIQDTARRFAQKEIPPLCETGDLPLPGLWHPKP